MSRLKHSSILWAFPTIFADRPACGPEVRRGTLRPISIFLLGTFIVTSVLRWYNRR